MFGQSVTQLEISQSEAFDLLVEEQRSGRIDHTLTLLDKTFEKADEKTKSVRFDPLGSDYIFKVRFNEFDEGKTLHIKGIMVIQKNGNFDFF